MTETIKNRSYANFYYFIMQMSTLDDPWHKDALTARTFAVPFQVIFRGCVRSTCRPKKCGEPVVLSLDFRDPSTPRMFDLLIVVLSEFYVQFYEYLRLFCFLVNLLLP